MMNPKNFSDTIIKIHVAFYNAPLQIVGESKNEVNLKVETEHFSIENHIKTRFRITFPDYIGKIGTYRSLFGHIMGNADNVCDTSDFIDLPISHVVKIYDYMSHIKLEELKKLKDL